ncbi:MAG: hypothetical protein HKM97_05590 [Acidimicrobiia bacterium]|nr:hypothetical protein [Acidimicrobiia bacterium]
MKRTALALLVALALLASSCGSGDSTGDPPSDATTPTTATSPATTTTTSTTIPQTLTAAEERWCAGSVREGGNSTPNLDVVLQTVGDLGLMGSLSMYAGGRGQFVGDWELEAGNDFDQQWIQVCKAAYQIRPDTPPPPPASSTTTTIREEAAKPFLMDSGFTNLPDGNVTWAAMFFNPNSDWVIVNARFDIELIDEAGRILDTGFDTAEIILPLSAIAISGTLYDSPARVTELNFLGGWDTVEAPPRGTGVWIIEKVAVDEDRYSTSITGEISSTFDDTWESVQLTAVFYDEADNIIGGDSTYVDRIYNDKVVLFDISVFSDVKIDRVEVYAGG